MVHCMSFTEPDTFERELQRESKLCPSDLGREKYVIMQREESIQSFSITYELELVRILKKETPREKRRVELWTISAGDRKAASY